MSTYPSRSARAAAPAYTPRKRFGQHFLHDHGIIDSIVRAIAPRPGQIMVEIGPGLGALTQPLVERLGHLVVIELDRDLAARLRGRNDLTVIEADVLKVDFASVPDLSGAAGAASVAGVPDKSVASTVQSRAGATDAVGAAGAANLALHRVPVAPRLRVVGNLPYNISTPILFHLLSHVDQIIDQHFMLQQEVVQRMVADPASSAYGRLSVMLQWRYAMEHILHVPPTSFSPPPRVDSAVVRMVPRPDAPTLELPLLSALVQVAFSQRRKLLRHSLGPWLSSRSFDGAFDLHRRAEEVPVPEYVTLAQSLSK